jgi:hypothetical protein
MPNDSDMEEGEEREDAQTQTQTQTQAIDKNAVAVTAVPVLKGSSSSSNSGSSSSSSSSNNNGSSNSSNGSGKDADANAIHSNAILCKPEAARMSSWLAGFLGSKKEPGAVPAKPEIIPLDGTYIAQFATSAKTHLASRLKGNPSAGAVDSSSEGEEEEETGLSSSFFEDDKDDKADSFHRIQLKFFNLPYTMTAEAVSLKTFI